MNALRIITYKMLPTEKASKYTNESKRSRKQIGELEDEPAIHMLDLTI